MSGLALDAITDALGNDAGERSIRRLGLRVCAPSTQERTAKAAPPQNPRKPAQTARSIRMAIFDASQGARRQADAIAIADGGDLLSFARIGLTTQTYMDAGAFGCLGVGVFRIATGRERSPSPAGR
jgi:acetolactate synthase-1/2/3 large subunit